MDILANTDFPDVRQKCLITSAGEGNLWILPREGGYLFRMYVELGKLNADKRVTNWDFTADHTISAANRIVAPHTIDVKEVVWWPIYEIGHRMTDRFDDVPTCEDRNPRVFTAADACHTHSPKAGQGMNVSMQDSFNLGWKLAHVLQGRADASLLRSYSAERRAEAKRLVDTDHEWARIMSAPPGQSTLDKGDEPRFVRAFKENLEFTTGLAVKYRPFALIGAPEHQALATGLGIGRRFPSARWFASRTPGRCSWAMRRWLMAAGGSMPSPTGRIAACRAGSCMACRTGCRSIRVRRSCGMTGRVKISTP